MLFALLLPHLPVFSLDALGGIALQHATPYAKMRRVTPVAYQTTSHLWPKDQPRELTLKPGLYRSSKKLDPN